MVTHIISQEPLMGENKRPLLRQLLQRLIDKQLEQQPSHFDLFKVSLTRPQCYVRMQQLESATRLACAQLLPSHVPCLCWGWCRCCVRTSYP